MSGVTMSSLLNKIDSSSGDQGSRFVIHKVPLQPVVSLPDSQQVVGPVCGEAVRGNPSQTQLWLGVYPARTVSPDVLKAKAHTDQGIAFNKPLRDAVPECTGTVVTIRVDRP
ncbi:hypothetical protein MP11Mi_07630 [Gordonia sp. MP11Mi]|uniref:Uncharacterized protein n=1 Tax=Gordonia sp. MP11Mi TaxID=3022769 RepID=A0AA97CV79_9ACTN